MKGKSLVLACLTLLCVAGWGKAAAYNFATFNETSGSRPFSVTNNTTSVSLGYATSVPVSFDFTTPTGLSTADRPATLTISTNSSPTPAAISGGLISQPVNPAVTFTFTETATGKNLLTAVVSGLLEGTNNGPTASLSGSASLGDTVTFTSDYLTFTTPSSNSALFGLSALSAPLSIGPGGFVNSFLADLNGSFVANAVPEPALVTITVTAGALMIRRRRAN